MKHAALALILIAAPAHAQSDGPALFQRCAACHTASGAGVPGAFPPLAREFRAHAASDAGRRWLAQVVMTGLAGAITIDGGRYAGFMPAQTQDPAEIAAVLNHVGTQIALAGAPFRRFTADEIKAYAQATSPAELGAAHARLVP